MNIEWFLDDTPGSRASPSSANPGPCCPCKRTKSSKGVDSSRFFANSDRHRNTPKRTMTPHNNQQLTAGFRMAASQFGSARFTFAAQCHTGWVKIQLSTVSDHHDNPHEALAHAFQAPKTGAVVAHRERSSKGFCIPRRCFVDIMYLTNHCD